jgi:hypothetical protein
VGRFLVFIVNSSGSAYSRTFNMNSFTSLYCGAQFAVLRPCKEVPSPVSSFFAGPLSRMTKEQATIGENLTCRYYSDWKQAASG